MYGKAMSQDALPDVLRLEYPILEGGFGQLADHAEGFAHQYRHGFVSVLQEKDQAPIHQQSAKGLFEGKKAERLHVDAMIAKPQIDSDCLPSYFPRFLLASVPDTADLYLANDAL